MESDYIMIQYKVILYNISMYLTSLDEYTKSRKQQRLKGEILSFINRLFLHFCIYFNRPMSYVISHCENRPRLVYSSLVLVNSIA